MSSSHLPSVIEVCMKKCPFTFASSPNDETTVMMILEKEMTEVKENTRHKRHTDIIIIRISCFLHYFSLKRENSSSSLENLLMIEDQPFADSESHGDFPFCRNEQANIERHEGRE
jgi:hypothetical protein